MRKALGRGLDALIPSIQKNTDNFSAFQENGAARVALDKIRPNHLQPRKNFDPEKLSELAASIKEHGIAQPILVSYDAASDTYELIAGERRLRASELAGLKEIDVFVKNPGSEQERLSLAMIENLQREDLNPIEEALGYLRMIKEFHISQTDLGQALGKSKSAISNTLRLLDLPEEMQKALEFGPLTEGHARALLMIEDPLERKRIFKIILDEKISVRDTEDLARQTRTNGHQVPAAAKPIVEKPADIKDLENGLQQALGTKVEIKTNASQDRGRIVLHFYTLEDFDKIVKMLKK